jgi:6-phosphogluconolactonase
MRPQRSDLTIVADNEALARAAAERITARFERSQGRIAFCLTGGSTPERLYELLAEPPYRDTWPWERIHLFWGDDRYVPHDDPCSNFGIAHRLLVRNVRIPPANVHPIPTSGGDPHADAVRYETELRAFYAVERLDPGQPLFDVVLMGVGSDGHTASLFPDRPELAERERWVVGVPEAGLAPFAPRVTLTFPAFASTREMLFLVSGADKREIMARVLAGEDLPANRAAAQGDLVWLIDRAAQGEQHHVA